MLYPPNLKSTQPAFVSSSSYDITFSLPAFAAASDIGHIQVRIVKQTNNQSIANISKYPDGTIYLNMVGGNGDGTYTVTISSSDLSTQWEAGVVYKIQVRFGSNAKYTSVSEFATWKKAQIDANAFSEWSTVMVVKCIDLPVFAIKNAESSSQSVVTSEKFEGTTTPLFEGSWELDQSVNHESLDKFKFELYSGTEATAANLIESSDWKQDRGEGTRTHRFKTVLTNGETYTVTYSIRTINGYEETAAPYIFSVKIVDLGDLEGISFRVDSESVYCNENGVINIYLTGEELSGNFVISRSSEASNYRVWEDIKYLFYAQETLVDRLVFQDFSVESGIKYTYRLQRENEQELRTTALYEEGRTSPVPHYVDFDYSYIYRDGIQLKLIFNQKMNSFKHTTLRSKQDTIGDKYPHLVSNGYANYAEFPLTGLITLQMDEDGTFFKTTNDGLTYGDELIIPADKFEYLWGERTESGSSLTRQPYTIDTNLTKNNIFIERKFREKVEEFLNNFNYKLYKSPTEGNIIIGLLNVQLQPKQELGRMIMEFSATAYEVVDNTLENLDNYGIITIGGRETLSSSEISYSFGQLDKIYDNMTKETDSARSTKTLYELIEDKENVQAGEGYRYSMLRLTAISVDQYPRQDIRPDILVIEKELADYKNAHPDPTDEEQEEIEALENQINDLTLLDNALSITAAAPIATTKLLINGNEVMVMPGRIYAVNSGISSLELAYTTYPVVINYQCERNIVVDASQKTESSIDISEIWGQISGIFTEDASVLRNYRYDYLGDTFRVYNGNADSRFVISDDRNHNMTVIDDTAFNVYRTYDILEVIKQEVQRQVEYDYDTFFTEQDEEGTLNDGSIFYHFGGLNSFTLEADPGTIIYVNDVPKRVSELGYLTLQLSGKNTSIYSAATQKETNNFVERLAYPTIHYPSAIVLDQSADSPEPSAAITSLKLKVDASNPNPAQYLVVNYKCTTRQIIKK